MMAARFLSRGRRSLAELEVVASKRIAATTSPCRHFSTNPPPRLDTDPNSSSGDNEPPPSPPKKHRQSFVDPEVNKLELGELERDLPPGFHKPIHDNDGRDAYWRPPWRNPRVEIISAEDFANRPRVTFSESFASMHDAMAVLSWMNQTDKDGMYDLYLKLMTASMAEGKKKGSSDGKEKSKDDIKGTDWGVLSTNTSHEYVIRVVAQSYNVTTSRAAGVIQLQHNEEQLKKDPNFKIHHEVQAHVDSMVRENIRQVYQNYGEADPLQFVEDPVASTGNLPREDTGSPTFASASELTDVDALLKRTRMQEIEDAKVRIANHIYVEDVDDRTRKVKVDKEATRLMKMKEEMESLYEDYEEQSEKGEADSTGDNNDKEGGGSAVASTKGSDDGGEEEVPAAYVKKKSKNLRTKVPKLSTKPPATASPYPDNNRGYNEAPQTRRPRWKYAAQIINTHMMENPPNSSRRGKGVAKRAKGRRHGRTIDGNTIIEQDGELRVASVAELEQTSWKHVRNESEFMFRGVKNAWLKMQLEGETSGWGRQQEVFAAPEPKAIESSDESDEGDGNNNREGEGEDEDGDHADEKEGGTEEEDKE